MAKTRFFSILLRLLKFFGIALGILFLLFGIVSWVVVKKKNEWLLDQIQSNMNESQSGQLKIGSIDLKLFRSFPDISIELDSIAYYEQRDSLRAPEEQPILRARQLFIALELFPLINEELIVSEISISQAQVNIVEVRKGVLNIDLALAHPAKGKVKPATKENIPKPPTPISPVIKKTPPPKVAVPAKPGIQIDLQLIDLSDILLTWKSFDNRKPSVLVMKKMKADFVKNKNVLTARLTSAHTIKALTIKSVELPPGDLSFSADVRFETDQQLLTIKESQINYEMFSASLQGTYAHKKNKMLDIQIDASSNDMEFLSIFIKPEVIKQNPNLLKQGDIYVKGKIFGELKKQPPQFDISFGVRDLDLKLPRQLGVFRNLGFKGSFNSGALPDYSEARFEINGVHAQLPGGFLKGHFRLNNFIEPVVNLKLDTKLKLDGYDEVFRIDFLKQLKGLISVQANFVGPLKLLGDHQSDSSRSSSVTLDSLSFRVAKTNQMVLITGKMETRYNQSILKQLTLTYGGNDLTINATIDNLMFYIFKRESELSAVGHLQSNQLFTKDFIPDTLLTAEVQDQIRNLSFDFKASSASNKTMGTSALPEIAFEINKLTCSLDKLPDLKRVDAAGLLSETMDGLKLDLHEFHATMPYGRLDVTGDLLIPEKKLYKFNARVKANKFPWTYVMELVAELQDGKGATGKNIPLKEMEVVTADIDLSASIITYPFDIEKLDVRNSRISFSPPGSNPISVEKLDLAFDSLYFIHPKNSGAITGMRSTRGNLELKQLSVPGLKKFDIAMQVTGLNDQLEVKFSTTSQKAKSEIGQLDLDISGKEPLYHLQFAVQRANLENYIKKFYKKKLMEGNIDYAMDLRTAGTSWADAKQNLTGEIAITGDSLRLYGVDIDKVLKKYEKSQNFNLTDLGAVLIAGPIGLAVTKGTDFVSLAAINLDSSQQTRIKTLVTKWKIEDRQLITEDVAFATTQNRIAFNGRIDFAKDSIPGLTIAVIDKNGCSLMDQRLYGTTKALKTGKLNVTKTLFGSVINFVNAVVGKDCKPVYTGSVPAPLP